MSERVGPDTYRRLLERLDAWFAEARSRMPGVIPCEGGCTACCHGPFDISIADVELVRDAVGRLPAEEQQEVRQRAEAVLARMRAIAPDWTPPFAIAALGEARFDRMSEELAATPCPLLDDTGRCRIYADRPLVCRLTGLGMITPTGRVIENACPIQERFPAYAALAPTPFDLEELEVAEFECLQGAARRLLGDAFAHDFETVVAAAVVTPAA